MLSKHVGYLLNCKIGTFRAFGHFEFCNFCPKIVKLAKNYPKQESRRTENTDTQLAAPRASFDLVRYAPQGHQLKYTA
jgi:hypothetical protein